MTASEQILAGVAEAVGLAEGVAGVRDVVLTVARAEPIAVRRLSRAAELPVPIVSAICNELRKRDVVARERPVRLTPRGRELFATGARPLEAACKTCAQREIVVPRELAPVRRELERMALAVPARRVELDQVHCDVETKLRRALALHEACALEGRRVLLLGDDDLTSVAIRLVIDYTGVRPARLTVVEIDPALAAFLARSLRRAPFPVEVIRHDLRDPLPERLCGAIDTVFTDPPYTPEGAALFLSRAAQAVAGAARGDVFLAFGARRPEDTLRVQRTIAELGFVVRSLVRNFNDYLGAGALGGVSHLYQLVGTAELRPLVGGRYDGPLYTGDFSKPVRRIRAR